MYYLKVAHSSAVGVVRAPELGKIIITVRNVAAVAALFNFAKSRKGQGLANLTPYSAVGPNNNALQCGSE